MDSRRLRRALVALGALLVPLSAAPPAGAHVLVEMAGTRLVITHHEGDALGARIILEHFQDGSRNGIRVSERAAFVPPVETITSEDPDCTANPFFNDVVCTPFPTEAVITTAGRDDVVLIGGSNASCVTTGGTPFTVNLGAGNDILRTRRRCGDQSSPPGTNRLHPRYLSLSGGPGNDELDGGDFNDALSGDSGDDELRGGDGADSLSGGSGTDSLEAGEGPDSLLGGTGNDTLDGGAGDDTLDGQGGADMMIGRGGTDTATYAARGSAVRVTLDANANDGAAGEGDNVTGVQIVIGGSGADNLTGGSGGDTLQGGGGNDELVGEDGVDVLSGGPGNDLIESRDSPALADSVSCGFGFDTVIADLEDTVPLRHPFSDIGCESVQRFAVDDGPPGRILDRSVRIGRDGSLRLRLRCPRRARVACRGTLRLTHTGRTRRTLAKTRYRVRLGRTGALRLRLSRRAAARARARGAIVARTKERGVSRKGPRSTVHLLKVRRHARR